MLTHKHIVIQPEFLAGCSSGFSGFQIPELLVCSSALSFWPHEEHSVIREEAKTTNSSMIAVPAFKLVDQSVLSYNYIMDPGDL